MIENLANAEDYNYYADEAYLDMIKNGCIKDILDIIAKHKEYSFRNAMLIYLQDANANKVMTVPKWKEIGRSVKIGESPIVIYKTIYDAYSGVGDPKFKGKGAEELETGIYQKVYVYSYSQTSPFAVRRKTGFDERDLFNHKEAVFEELKNCIKGFKVNEVDKLEKGTAELNIENKELTINKGLSKETYFHTLVQACSVIMANSYIRGESYLGIRTIDKRVLFESRAVDYIISKRFYMQPPKVEDIYSPQSEKGYRDLLLSLIHVRKVANQITNIISNAISYDKDMKLEQRENAENAILNNKNQDLNRRISEKMKERNDKLKVLQDQNKEMQDELVNKEKE